MKRSASQDLSPAPKKHATDSFQLNRKYIQDSEVTLPDELPVFQISRKSLIALRTLGVTYFSAVPSDVFGCILATLYGLANLHPPQLGALNLREPPADSVLFLIPHRSRVKIKHANGKYYTIDAHEQDSHIVSFQDSTCKFPDESDFEFGNPHAFPANCNTKTYTVDMDRVKLSNSEWKEIAFCDLEYSFPYGVVFSTNCVALVGMMDGDNHRVANITVLYFSPGFELREEHTFGVCEFCRAASVDRDDNLYILADDDIDIYSIEEFEHIRNIWVGPTLGFCLTEDGGLVLARDTRLDLYKKK
jgi:hypothetical protein